MFGLIPNSVNLDKSNTFLKIFFCVYFCTYHSVFKIEYFSRLGALECPMPNATSFFVAVPVTPAITPNHGSMNRLLWVHSSRFLRRVSVRWVVFEHSTGEHVSLYRPNSETYVQERLYYICLFVSSLLGPCVKLKLGTNNHQTLHYVIGFPHFDTSLLQQFDYTITMSLRISFPIYPIRPLPSDVMGQ